MDLSSNSRRAITWMRAAFGGITGIIPSGLLPNSRADEAQNEDGEFTVDPVVIKRPANTWGVNCCDARLSGIKAAHCSTCHRNFTGPWAFDKHRAYNKCRHPEDVGLILVARWFPCWGRVTEEGERDYDQPES